MQPLSVERWRDVVQGRLLEWFNRTARSFQWRSVERAVARPAGEPIVDPYVVLVSEVMLQQTQTARVAAKLPEFLRRFPDARSLAQASQGEVIRAWQGMGYNSRVLRLQAAARAVVERHAGRFPESVAELIRLPGLGPYTAAAVACFAFGAAVPVVDVNVARVLGRIFHKCHTASQVMPAAAVAVVAEAMLPANDAYRWHQALMDLGATVCTARNPACGGCPVAGHCLSANPLPIELFRPEHAARAEPAILGTPRRIWRGRLVEILRLAEEALPVATLIDRALAAMNVANATTAVRRQLLAVVNSLAREGFAVCVANGVPLAREGEIAEHDHVRLPG